MQSIRTIWITLVSDYTWTIPVEFGKIPISGSREEVVWTLTYIIQCDARTLNYIREKEQRTITLKFGSGWLWFLCSALVLNEINTPQKCHVQFCKSVWDIAPTSLWRPDGRLRRGIIIRDKRWCLCAARHMLDQGIVSSHYCMEIKYKTSNALFSLIRIKII